MLIKPIRFRPGTFAGSRFSKILRTMRFIPTIATLTSDEVWGPSIMDHDPFEKERIKEPTDLAKDGSMISVNWCRISTEGIREEIDVGATIVKPIKVDYKNLSKYFLNSNENVIEHTFKATTQFARSGWITGGIRNTYRTPFPAMNVMRRNEPVATDQVYSDVASYDGGYEAAQFFVGVHTKVCDVFGLRSDQDFVNTLNDVIRKRCAMDQLVSDRAQVEVSERVKSVLIHLCIRIWQSGPHYQHQNAAERTYQDVKRNTNSVLNVTGAPPETWFYCLEYVFL